jgi:NADPH2:quinone reductase
VGGDKVQLKALGATHIIDRYQHQDVILGHIRDVVGDDLIYAFDGVSPPKGQILALNALSSYRKGALARLLPEGPVEESLVKGKKAGFELRNVFGVSQAHLELAREFWKRLPGYLEAGSIRPLESVVKQGLEAGHVNEVLDRYRDGQEALRGCSGVAHGTTRVAQTAQVSRLSRG